MFVEIETNGASHIVIAVPGDMAAKSLPTLAAMLEQNAVFVAKGWQDMKTVKASMRITLGEKLALDNNDGQEMLVAMKGEVIGEEFELATPEVFASNAKKVARLDELIKKLTAQLSLANSEMQAMRERIAALAGEEA